MYIAKLTNLDDPDQKYYELLATVPATEIIPPVAAAGSNGGSHGDGRRFHGRAEGGNAGMLTASS